MTCGSDELEAASSKILIELEFHPVFSRGYIHEPLTGHLRPVCNTRENVGFLKRWVLLDYLRNGQTGGQQIKN